MLGPEEGADTVVVLTPRMTTTRENLMTTEIDRRLNEEGTVASNSARVMLATVCVLGLVALMFLHIEPPANDREFRSEGDTDTTVMPAAIAPPFLHAPTRDPSLPSLDATFSRTDVAPADEAMAPTF